MNCTRTVFLYVNLSLHPPPPTPPPMGNIGDNDFSSITVLLKALHCGEDLLRVITLLFIIVNSTEVYICVISQARHCGGARKVIAPHISPAIPRPFPQGSAESHNPALYNSKFHGGI